MSKICNTVILHNDYVEIKVTKTGDSSYNGTVLVDIEDLSKIGKVRITNDAYAYLCSRSGRSVAHEVLSHKSNMETVVDHINGNSLDNRKKNLRVLLQKDNANNRHSSRNNTGVVGIARRNVGGYAYYRASVTDRNHPVKSGETRSACKRYWKQFNINKLGKEKAFEAAEKWLKEMRIKFGYIDS